MWREPTVTDNSGLFTVTSSHTPGFAFGIGTTTVMYSAVDASGNRNVFSFDVTVLGEYYSSGVFLVNEFEYIEFIVLPQLILQQ